jgi:hypothetical protein
MLENTEKQSKIKNPEKLATKETQARETTTINACRCISQGVKPAFILNTLF